MRIVLTQMVVALLLILLFSCDKKTDIPPVVEEPEVEPGERTLAKKDIIGSYLVTKVELKTASGRQDITTEWFRSYAGDCAQDDLTEFKLDNSFVVVDGTVACNESTDDTGTWDVISNTKLRLDADTAAIEACTSTLLRMVSPVYSSAQGQMIFTYQRR